MRSLAARALASSCARTFVTSCDPNSVWMVSRCGRRPPRPLTPSAATLGTTSALVGSARSFCCTGRASVKVRLPGTVPWSRPSAPPLPTEPSRDLIVLIVGSSSSDGVERRGTKCCVSGSPTRSGSVATSGARTSAAQSRRGRADRGTLYSTLSWRPFPMTDPAVATVGAVTATTATGPPLLSFWPTWLHAYYAAPFTAWGTERHRHTLDVVR